MTCASPATNEVYVGKEFIVDGTPCSYDDPHSVCVQVRPTHLSFVASKTSVEFSMFKFSSVRCSLQGKCIAIGCDSVVGSRARLDDCGVCRGNGTTCRRSTFHFTGLPDSGTASLWTLRFLGRSGGLAGAPNPH